MNQSTASTRRPPQKRNAFFISQRASYKDITFGSEEVALGSFRTKSEENLSLKQRPYSIDSDRNYNKSSKSVKTNSFLFESPLLIKRKHEQKIRYAQAKFIQTGLQKNRKSTSHENCLQNLGLENFQILRKKEAIHQSYRGKNMPAKRNLNPKTKFHERLKFICYKISVAKYVLQALKENSIIKTEYAAHIAQYFAFKRSTATDFIFNVDDFKKGNLKARLPLWSRRILTENPTERSYKDCRSLQALFRSLQWFDQFAEEVQVALCKSISLISIEPQRIVVRKSQVPMYLYIVYSGSVFSMSEDDDGYVDTAILRKGESFGEMSLLRGSLRNNTVVGREYSEILYMNKESFLSACSRIFQEEVQEKKTFLQSTFLFQNQAWTPEKIHQLSLESQIQRYKTDAIITLTEPEEDEWIYACMEGSCRVFQEKFLLKKLERRRSNYYDIFDIDIDEVSPDSTMYGVYEKQEVIDILLEIFSDDSAEVDRIMQRPKEEVLEIIENYLQEKGWKNITEDNEGVQLILQKIAFKESEKNRLHMKKSKFHKELVNARHSAEVRNTSIDDKPTRRNPENLTELLIERKCCKDGPTVLCMINVLQAGAIYDLKNVLNSFSQLKHQNQGMRQQKRERRLLVSNNCKVLKIRKAIFLRYCYGLALEHSKDCALDSMYMTDASLEDLVKTKTEWLSYKRNMVDRLMKPTLNSPKRSYLKSKLVNDHLQEVSIFQLYS